jgi:hypothetical protein
MARAAAAPPAVAPAPPALPRPSAGEESGEEQFFDALEASASMRSAAVDLHASASSSAVAAAVAAQLLPVAQQVQALLASIDGTLRALEARLAASSPPSSATALAWPSPGAWLAPALLACSLATAGAFVGTRLALR